MRGRESGLLITSDKAEAQSADILRFAHQCLVNVLKGWDNAELSKIKMRKNQLWEGGNARMPHHLEARDFTCCVCALAHPLGLFFSNSSISYDSSLRLLSPFN
jgi:hypothetical protein